MSYFSRQYAWTRILLWAIALFFGAEFFLHFFGMQFLEHDKIFLFTHDRYIAAFAMTMSGLSLIVSTNIEKYRYIFLFTMLMMGVGFGVASLVSYEGGYNTLFPVVNLDQSLGGLGVLFLAWYFVSLSCWYFKK